MYILPAVKNYVGKNGVFTLDKKLTVRADKNVCAAGLNLLKEHFKPFGFNVISSVTPQINAVELPACGKTEYYTLEVTEKGVTVGYTGALSFRNAAATLIALTKMKEDEYYVDCCKIEDYADYPYRGFMLDVARQFIDIETIKERIVLMSKAKYTVLHIHLFDTERYAIRSAAVPALNVKPLFRQYTIEEMADVVDYAAAFGITVIPEIDLPGHGLYVLERLPELKCVKNGEPTGIWDACVANEETYRVIDLMIEELTHIFPCDYIHMGGDELSFYDMKDSGYWPNWYECDRCKKLAEENGYKTASDYYCHFVRRVYDIVKSHGKKLMIWNDSIDISKSPDLPRDILIHFWRVAVETRGPREGCSMQRFLEEGFKVVNSFYEEAYADDYIVEERLSEWTPASSPETKAEYKENIVGGEMCAWGIRNHFDYTIPSNLFLFASRLWNSAVTDAKESRAALNRQLICPEDGFVNIFGVLGGGMMPLYGDKKYCPDAETDRKKVEEAIEKITRKLAEGRYDALVIKPIIDCLEALRSSLPEKDEKGE